MGLKFEQVKTLSKQREVTDKPGPFANSACARKADEFICAFLDGRADYLLAAYRHANGVPDKRVGQTPVSLCAGETSKYYQHHREISRFIAGEFGNMPVNAYVKTDVLEKDWFRGQRTETKEFYYEYIEQMFERLHIGSAQEIRVYKIS